MSWLHSKEHVTTEQTQIQSQTIKKVEAKVGLNIKKNIKVLY